MAAALVDTLGRRSTIIWSNLALSAFTALIGLRFLFHWPVSASAAALCLAMLSFSLGPGPLTFVVISEMLPLHLRAKVVSLSVFCNRVGSGTIALTFLSLKCAIGPAAAFGLYAAVGLVVTAFYYTSVVESTGVRNLARAASRPPPRTPSLHTSAPSVGLSLEEATAPEPALLSARSRLSDAPPPELAPGSPSAAEEARRLADQAAMRALYEAESGSRPPRPGVEFSGPPVVVGTPIAESEHVARV